MIATQAVGNVKKANRRVIRSLWHGDRTFVPALIALRALLAALTLAPPAVSWAQAPCPVPDSIALHDISLPAAKQEVATDQHLTVLTFGGVRPAGSDAESQGATYPARLRAALGAALPEVQVTVVNEPAPGKTSVAVPGALPGLIQQTGARLVIWGPGGRDVAARVDLNVFRAAVTGGIEAVRHSGADLILLDTMFVPSPARMVSIEAYRERLLAAAAEKLVPVLRRHDLMRLWGGDGTLDLAARDPGERVQVARHLFSCVAGELAGAIAAAVR